MDGGLSFSDPEKDCIRLLARLFESGKTGCSVEEDLAPLVLAEDAKRALVATMLEYGFLEKSEAKIGSILRIVSYRITAHAVQYARMFRGEDERKRERKDVLENLKYTWRRHPVVGWVFVIYFVLGVVIGSTIAVITFLEKVGLK